MKTTPRLVAVLLMLSVTASVQAQTELIFSQTPFDPMPVNPHIFVQEGGTTTLDVFIRTDFDNVIYGFDMSLGTASSSIAGFTDSKLTNPLIDVSVTPVPIWGDSFDGGAFLGGFVFQGNPNPGINPAQANLYPNYDPASRFFHLGTLEISAVAPAGNTTTFGAGIAVIGGNSSEAITEVFVGDGNPPVNAQGGFIQAAGSITILSTLPGDYNSDGVVDAADYTVWRDNKGNTGDDLLGDGNGDHVVDTVDYALWRENFGNTSGVPQSPTPVTAPAAGSIPAGPGDPMLQVVSQGLTDDGNRSYLLQIVSDDTTGSLAVELGITGTIIDVLAAGIEVDTESNADASDGTGGYEKAEDSWYDDAIFDTVLPGNNPFTGTVTQGWVFDEIAGELFVSLGSGTGNGSPVDLLQLVVAPDAEITWAGIIAQDGLAYDTAGSIPVPEPATLAVLTLATPMLWRRRHPI